MLALNVAFLCLFLSVAADFIGIPEPRLPSINDDKDCIKEVRPSTEEVRRIQRGELPTTIAQNCLLTCIWKKAGVMTKNGLFLQRNASIFIKYKFNVPEQRMGFVRDTVGNCMRKASSVTNQCMMGGYMYKCIMLTRRGYKVHAPAPARNSF